MFQPIEENVSVYKKVVAQIQEMIMHGELKKGDRLPPERQLAEMLGVGRPALKQAISALVQIFNISIIIKRLRPKRDNSAQMIRSSFCTRFNNLPNSRLLYDFVPLMVSSIQPSITN